MKRIERNTYNNLRKNVTNDTVYVEIPTTWTYEARQTIHELLTISKHMHAARICPNVLTYEPVILYARGQSVEQETADIDTVMKSLRVSALCWNGFRPDSFSYTV